MRSRDVRPSTLRSPPAAGARSSGEQGSVVLARVEASSESAGRTRLRLRAPRVGDQQAPIDGRALSFVSGETMARLPMRAVSVQSTKDAILIEAELLPAARALRIQSVLVMFRAAPAGEEGPPAPAKVVGGLDYLARDFDAFRSLLLDRMTSLAPSWTDRTPADLGVMMAEVLAYLADDLTYWQDAVATEAYLTTARRRMSVRRHARLLDYWIDQGVGARVWVRFDARLPVTVPRGTQLLAAPPGQPVVERGTVPYQQQRARATAVFETTDDLRTAPELGEIQIWDEGRRHFVVPAGATSVEVLDRSFVAGEAASISGALHPGAVLMFESRASGAPAPHPVRLTACKQVSEGRIELQWARQDAPPQDLPVTRTTNGAVEKNLTVLRGNVVLADFGESMTSRLQVRAGVESPYQPPLLPYSLVSLGAPPPNAHTPAALCTEEIQRHEACPAIVLNEHTDFAFLASSRAHPSTAAPAGPLPPAGRVWKPVPDLLLSGPYSCVFVAEAQEEGWSLRFGDGVFGRSPPLGSFFEAGFRVGDTGQSNVGVRAITTIVAPPKGMDDAGWALAGLRVTNPLAATGGRGPETSAHAKQTAPALLREVHAAITLDDYATIASQVTGVSDAAALLRWTGSFSTTFVHVRVDPHSPDPAWVLRQVGERLDAARLAGRAILVREPDWVPLHVTLRARLSPGFSREAVQAALREAFVGSATSGRMAGFFDPSRWRFGDTVWASAIATWAKGVRGVASVELRRLARVEDPGLERLPEALAMTRSELPQLLDEPFQPETGTLELELVGGREDTP